MRSSILAISAVVFSAVVALSSVQANAVPIGPWPGSGRGLKAVPIGPWPGSGRGLKAVPIGPWPGSGRGVTATK
jgi:hypothetical protein